MIHQPLLSGMQGQASDIKIHADRLIQIRERMNRIMAANTGKDYETIARDTDRDHFLTADEAAAYGLVDQVITKR